LVLIVGTNTENIYWKVDHRQHLNAIHLMIQLINMG